MMTAALFWTILAVSLLLLLGLIGQMQINRAFRIARERPTVLPPPDPSQAFEYGLPWVCADGTILTGPPIASVETPEEYAADRRLETEHDRWRATRTQADLDRLSLEYEGHEIVIVDEGHVISDERLW